MSSFFEKLKKGMGVEDQIEEEETEEEEEKEVEEKVEEAEKESPEPKAKKKQKKKNKPIKIKKIEIKTETPEEETEEEEEEIEEEKTEEEEEEETEEEDKPSPSPLTKAQEKEWSSFSKEEEGQLAIDVYQTEKSLVIQSTIAGVKPENLDISIERDIITIKGIRQKPFNEKCDYFVQECFWGPFSREIIVPVEVDPEKAKAEMKENVLTIEIPKILREKKRKILVRG